MIKFFRKTRRNLLSKNPPEETNIRAGKTASQLWRYLLYAFGEIVLVVIGILIALQINNLNQERILKEQNHIILQNLNKEFSENLVELNSTIERLNSVIDGLHILLIEMRNQDNTLTTSEFDQLLNKTFWMPNWKPSSFVLVELKNSGALSKLSNNNLKSLLFKWEREFDQMENNNINFNQYGAEYVEFVTKNGSVRNIDALTESTKSLKNSTIAQNDLGLLKNPEFENRADNFYFLSVRLKEHFKTLSHLMKDIIEVSNANLN